MIKLIKLSSGTMKGPLVDAVIQAVNVMYDRGAPVEINNIGFNQTDYANPIIQQFVGLPLGSEVSVNDLGQVTYALLKYKNRQLPQAPELRRMFEQEKAKLIPANVQQPENAISAENTTPGQLVVKNVGTDNYGKLILYVPECEQRLSKVKMNRVLRQRAEDLGWKQERDNYGNFDFPLWKGFKIDRANPNHINIKPEFIPALIQILDEFNKQPARKKDGVQYDYSSLIQIAAQENQSKEEKGKEKVKVVASNDRSITFQFNYNPVTVSKVKDTVPPRNRRWDNTNKAWTIQDVDDKTCLTYIAQIFDPEQYDVTDLVSTAKNLKVPEQAVQNQQVNEIIPLDAVDVSDTTKFLIGLRFPRNDKHKDEFKELIKFSFPTFGQDGQRDIDNVNWLYLLRGSYSDFADFYRLLKSRNFDTTKFTNILANFTKPKEQGGKGILQKEKVEGWINGKSANTPEVIAEFHDKINQFISPELKPFDEQYVGMAHLYSRKSSLLGDATGAGKTLMNVAAANLKLQETNGKALIITLKATTIQWMKEIKKTLNKDERVSFYPEDGAKWTILYYNQWSDHHIDKEDQTIDPETQAILGIKRRDKLVQTVKDQKYDVLILDEIHCIKNDSSRSNNILEATKDIPVRWGASATVVANRPMDAQRVLKGIGHRLGDLTPGQFKREFGGMVPRGYRGAYIEGTEAEQRQAAEKLRKWLALSGVYIKRSKEDMNPNMPTHSIVDLPIELEPSEMKSLNARIAQRLKEYKDPELAISNMIAERTELATAKVPASLEMARNLLEQDKKVLIFTCFKASAAQLIEGATSIVQRIQKENKSQQPYKVVSIMGGTPNREDIIRSFKEDPNTKVLVLSILAGGTGLDLPNVVNDVIINDFSWTPKDAEQSEGRAFRINSKTDVDTQYVIATGTADEIYYSDVQQKKKIAKLVQDLDRDEAVAQQEGKPVHEIRAQRIIAMQQIKQIEKETQERLAALNQQRTANRNWFLKLKE